MECRAAFGRASGKHENFRNENSCIIVMQERVVNQKEQLEWERLSWL